VRVVVAPDKFKGSLTAVQAAEAVAAGLRRAVPGVDVVLLPVADGGDGTLEAAYAAGYSRVPARVTGPTGEPVDASVAVRGTDAVVEMADASGLSRLPGGVPAPLTASTYGTGELLQVALDSGARHVVLGIGGSATTDGGAGMAQAVGVRLLDAAGEPLPPGGAALLHLDRIDVSGLDARWGDGAARVTVASDVDNPLVGPRGAAAVYGPQKGASPADVELLDRALRRWAEVLRRDLGVDVAERPGAGAAGGLGAGAMAVLGARLTSGIALLLDVLGFADAVVGADLVITGEGALDEQSLAGKAPVGVATAAGAAGVPVVALAGQVLVGGDDLRAAGIREARALLDLEPDAAVAQRDAARLLQDLAARLGEDLRDAGH